MLKKESRPSLKRSISMKASYYVIYDGDCNLCTTLVQLLERLDGGEQFAYIPMQAKETLQQFGITPQDCELGMILLDANHPQNRWQGSDAALKIGSLLPAGDLFVNTYYALPGMKWVGERVYEQIRDRRYELFGKRQETYCSTYNACGNPKRNAQH
jgi:predicted DCC family thiol-disulfide oxidoreductase YuxK